MHFKRVKHAFSRHNNLLWLFFHRQTSDKGCHLLSSLPLGQLAEALLAGPHARMDDLEEQLARLWIENEDVFIEGNLGKNRKKIF